ncbi:MAG: hypothetical protein GY719_23535 [bacterium]|nr:hypothetical protein [bacterium]
MPAEAEIRDLVAVSRFAGSDLLLAQGAGGNTSVKTAAGSRLLIKASGFRLADVTGEAGYLDMDLPALRQIMEEPELADLAPLAAHDETVRRVRGLLPDEGGPRPSMETGFHLLLDRVVLHTHPIYLNAFTCSREGQAACQEEAGADTAWVPYAAPGYPLARAVAESCAAHLAEHGHQPTRIVLGNHGLITTSADVDTAIRDTRALAGRGEQFFGSLPGDACELGEPTSVTTRWARDLQAIFDRVGHAAVARPARRRALLAAVRRDQPLTGGPLVPDDAIYGVHLCRQLAASTPPADWLHEHGKAQPAEELPAKAVVALEGEGVVLVAPNEASLDFMEENLLANVLIHELIARRDQPRYLQTREVDELLAMESEQYRQKLAQRRGEPCRS